MAYMKAVCRRVETDIEFDLFILKELSDFFLIGTLFDKAPLFEDVVYVVKFADVIRYKIKFHLYNSPFAFCRVAFAGSRPLLFCPVKPVSSVAQSRNYVCVFVELFVFGRDIYVYVRMSLLQGPLCPRARR